MLILVFLVLQEIQAFNIYNGIIFLKDYEAIVETYQQYESIEAAQQVQSWQDINDVYLNLQLQYYSKQFDSQSLQILEAHNLQNANAKAQLLEFYINVFRHIQIVEGVIIYQSNAYRLYYTQAIDLSKKSIFEFLTLYLQYEATHEINQHLQIYVGQLQQSIYRAGLIYNNDSILINPVLFQHYVGQIVKLSINLSSNYDEYMQSIERFRIHRVVGQNENEVYFQFTNNFLSQSIQQLNHLCYEHSNNDSFITKLKKLNSEYVRRVTIKDNQIYYLTDSANDLVIEISKGSYYKLSKANITLDQYLAILNRDFLSCVYRQSPMQVKMKPLDIDYKHAQGILAIAVVLLVFTLIKIFQKYIFLFFYYLKRLFKCYDD